MTGLDAVLVFLVVLWGVTALLAVAELCWTRQDQRAAREAKRAAREAAAIRAHEERLWIDVDDLWPAA